MNSRRPRAIPLACALAACALLSAAASGTARAAPLLSEVLYDAVGSDDGLGFVEIAADPGTLLDGWTVEGINGANGSAGPVLMLAGVVPADGLFVVADADSSGATGVAGADLLLDFDFQNGPDSVVLRDATAVLDAVGYGVFGAGEVFAGEGNPAPDVPAGSSLARRFADVDSGDNAADWVVLGAPTPGSAPLLGVPEPGAAWLLGSGLLLLACRHGRPARA